MENNYNNNTIALNAAFGITFRIVSSQYTNHFEKDDYRHVFKIEVKSKYGKYRFNFGQSIFNGSKEPNEFDVISCLTKYEPESFKDFIADYGYSTETKTEKNKAMKIYKAVVKECNGFKSLFENEHSFQSYISFLEQIENEDENVFDDIKNYQAA